MRAIPGADPDWWRSGTFEGHSLPDLLRARDIGAVFRFLRTRGWSRAAIAAASGLAETRVRQIAQGRQRISSYEVLQRIAAGLDIEPGWMGLAYAAPQPLAVSVDGAVVSTGHRPDSVTVPAGAQSTADIVEGASEKCGWEDPMQRRQFVGALAGVAVGSVPPNVAQWLPGSPVVMPLPDMVTRHHVAMVRKVTELHRATDLRVGGGAVRESATGYLRWADGLLRGRPESDVVARELRQAVGYLYNVTGWVHYDLGRHDGARRYLTQGLLLAREIDEYSLMADAYYKLGRVSIDQGLVLEALSLWQIGLLVAQNSGSPASLGLLHANTGCAYGVLGDERQMVDAFARADTELGKADPAAVPRWCRFFTHSPELHGLRYGAYCAVAAHPEHRSYATQAIEAAEHAAKARRPGDGRSYTFDVIAAATGHLIDGNLDEAERYAHTAIDRAARLRSARPRARLVDWADTARGAAARHSGLAEAVQRVSALSAAA